MWSHYKKKQADRLHVAHNDAVRILLKRPRWWSASEMLVAAGVDTLQAVLRSLTYKLIFRVDEIISVMFITFALKMRKVMF